MSAPPSPTAPGAEPSPAAGEQAIAGYRCHVYDLVIAGRTIRAWGPVEPYSLIDRPANQQRFEQDEYLPYWAQPWPAAVMLADFVARHDPAGDAPMLEVGSGLGISAIGLARAGRCVIASDYDAEALTFIRHNAACNGATLHDVRLIDWRQPPRATFETLLAADVTYEKRSLEPLTAFIASCLAPRGRAYVADANRAAAGALPRVLKSAGLTFEIVPAEGPAIGGLDTPDSGTRPGRIFVISR
ncbi:MAG: hypothetical protein U1A27_03995 [Phycisphaerae bacterium]